MAVSAHLVTTPLVMIDAIEATVVIDVTDGAADHPDAPTATRMPMLRAEATETESAKIDMEVRVVTVRAVMVQAVMV
jgi:hypothetical protein